MAKFLSKDDFAKIVSNAPLVSIDLCILKSRKLLVGKRKNPPARNYFFVPGGRILKSELISNALKRILGEELGLRIKSNKIQSIKTLGIYEHFYKDNFLNNKKFDTHYVVLAYLIPFESLMKVNYGNIFEQHSEYKWLELNSINNKSLRIHKNTIKYLENPLIKNTL